MSLVYNENLGRLTATVIEARGLKVSYDALNFFEKNVCNSAINTVIKAALVEALITLFVYGAS